MAMSIAGNHSNNATHLKTPTKDTSVTKDKKFIALTFDDGPVKNENFAYEILNTLEAYHLNATFFYCGANITDETAQEIIRSYKMGNEIGNHTTHHEDLTKLSDADLKSEIETTANLLHKITHLNHFLVRPPYLSYNDHLLKTIPAPLIGARVDSKDWSGIEPELIIHNVLSNVTDGDIILMHENQRHTATAIKTLIPNLLQLGYQITTVSQLMAAKGVTLSSGQMYSHA